MLRRDPRGGAAQAEHAARAPRATRWPSISASAADRAGEARPSSIRGELDWIVMKALEKDRSPPLRDGQRLAADVQRTWPASRSRRARRRRPIGSRKFAPKHRPALVAASAFAALLVAGAVLSTWQAIRATRAETAANRETLRATIAEVHARELGRAVAAEVRARGEAEKAGGPPPTRRPSSSSSRTTSWRRPGPRARTGGSART